LQSLIAGETAGTLCISLIHAYGVSQKIPLRFFDMTFFPKRLGIFNQFLHTYYTFISALDGKLLFNYFQL